MCFYCVFLVNICTFVRHILNVCMLIFCMKERTKKCFFIAIKSQNHKVTILNKKMYPKLYCTSEKVCVTSSQHQAQPDVVVQI